jgi:ApbE superfamily uncharacterized protein (UPF0280 family)
MNGACSARLPDGRLHLQHGPIDVLIECWGDGDEVQAAYRQACERFGSILGELVEELARLRAPIGAAAVWPHRNVFITPMAAVAGAGADELLEALLHGRSLRKACVNDGGDIALHLAPGEEIRVGIVNDPTRPQINADVSVQSRGIADAVTVLARTAALADAAATLVANAVNVEHPAIRRLPAREVKEDSDLGDLPVTVGVDALPQAAVAEALERGVAAARAMQQAGLLEAAYLALQGRALAC